MQYKGGKRVKKNTNKSCSNNEYLILTHSVISPTIPADRKKDIIKSQINNNPAFLILLPWLVVNSDFSLSKVRRELYLTSKIAPIIANQNITPPNGCGVIYPRDNPMKNVIKNIKFQKLSLFNLALIKLRIIAPNFIDILHSYNTNHLIKKLCFFGSPVRFKDNLVRYFDNLLHQINKMKRAMI